MRRISPAKTAVATGTVVGMWHLIWVALVGVGWAKPVMDFILQLHFINLQYSLAPYSAVTAAMLIALTFAVGASFGFIFAVVWNWLTFEEAPGWASNTKTSGLTSAQPRGSR